MEFFKARSSEPGSRDTQSLWLIIYTDMVSNLMIFFMLLYCITWFSDNEKAVAEASFKEAFSGEKGAVIEAIARNEKGLAREKDIEQKLRLQFDNVEINEERIMISLPTPVLFDRGKAGLKRETAATLHEIAGIIKDMDARITVEGHTDDTPVRGGDFSSNWELSAARAFSVIRYFTENEEISPLRLSAVGCGEFHPQAANDSEENRAKNRRIEICILKDAG